MQATPHDPSLQFVVHSRPWRRLVAALRSLSAKPAFERPDAATLRDLGLDPGKCGSMPAECSGQAALPWSRVVPWP